MSTITVEREGAGPSRSSFPASPPPMGFIALRAAIALGLLALGMFATAGDLRWPEAWMLLALYGGWAAYMLTWLLRHDPELLRARLDWRNEQAGQKRWDVWLMRAITPFALALLVVPGLDRRAALSQMPWPLEVVGFVAMMLGLGLIGETMKANPFLFRTVKIDVEHGHRVITTGPYAIVRHPMYVGVFLVYLGVPLALGSYLGLVPAVVTVLGIVLRTAWEDRTLTEELPGYREYATKTRYRLIPGVW